MELVTGENDKGRRLDRILRKALPDCPLPLLHRLLRKGQVFVDGKPAKAQYRVDSGVKISISGLKDEHREKPLREKANHTLGSRFKEHKIEILWQGQGLIAINKPVGLAVHGNESLNTMVSSFLADKLPSSLSFKPGPLHRLDKPSSGIVVFSDSLEGARLFSSLMREQKVKKTYLTIVEGHVEKEQIWEDYLVRDRNRKKTFLSSEVDQDIESKQYKKAFGKKAITKVTTIASAISHRRQFSLIKAEITTGRTHQIRAQACSHGHPLAGDRKYGGIVFNGGFYLHAWKLEFLNTVIEAPLPFEFREKIKELFGLNMNPNCFSD